MESTAAPGLEFEVPILSLEAELKKLAELPNSPEKTKRRRGYCNESSTKPLRRSIAS